MKTSGSSKSSSVYYFSLIFCTHVLHISAYITSMCGNHFSLFCCADINKKRKACFREAYIVFLNAFWFQNKYRKKKIAHTAVGVFKENTFFSSEFSYTSTGELWNSRWRAMDFFSPPPLIPAYKHGNGRAPNTESSPLHTASGWIDPTSFLLEVSFLTTDPRTGKENTAKFQRKVNPSWVINSIATNFFSFAQFGGQSYEKLFQHCFSCHSNHK